jgi:hypothetical protein
LFDAFTGAADLWPGSFVLGIQLDTEPVLECLLDTRRKAHGSPEPLDRCFGGVHVEVWLLADGLALVPAEAEEMRIAALSRGWRTGGAGTARSRSCP